MRLDVILDEERNMLFVPSAGERRFFECRPVAMWFQRGQGIEALSLDMRLNQSEIEIRRLALQEQIRQGHELTRYLINLQEQEAVVARSQRWAEVRRRARLLTPVWFIAIMVLSFCWKLRMQNPIPIP